MDAEPKHVSELVGLLVKRMPEEEVAELLRLTDAAWFDRLVAAREEG